MTRIALALTLLLLAHLPRDAHAQGLLGLGEMSAGGSLLFGERLEGGGFGIVAHFEYASMFEETALGGYMGAEFFASLGYESYAGTDPYGGSMTQGPLIFDVTVGFPVTLFKVGSGGAGTTLFTVGLGAGMNVQHAFGLVRARLLTTLSASTFLELMGRWTPSEASSDYTEKTGLDVYETRVSLMLPLSEDLDAQLFGEWSLADRTREGNDDPMHVAKPPPEVTTAFQSVWRFGIGFIF